MSYCNKPNYRVYALVIGEVIKIGKVFDCEIRKIELEEQKKRIFLPIQGVFSENDNYNTYATSLPYIDPLRIKSEYAIICDIEEYDENAALGGAIRRIDRICRFLTLAYSEDFRNKFNRNSNFLPYLYQVNKIYSINNKGEEGELNFKLESGHIYLPNRPELSEWRCQTTDKFLEEAFNFHNETLERAIKYLYRSSIGNFIKDSPEKIALDHFKSIEIIIKSLSGKKKKDFKKRVEIAAEKIKLDDEERNKINQYWDSRSKYSDTAHFSPYDQAERYPNQFPLPSNVNYPYSFTDSIAVNVCVKYFFYVKNLFNIDIEELFPNEEECLGEVNSQWESNHLWFQTLEKDTSKIKRNILECFVRKYNIKKEDISEITLMSNKKAVLRTKYNI